MKSTKIFTLNLQLLFTIACFGQQTAPDAVPNWARQEWDFLTQGSGIWIADNSEYKSESPYDAFGIQWEYGIGKMSLKGRLFGINDGKDVATFWEFRIFWHPTDKQLVMMQFGRNGAYGVGLQKSIGKIETEVWQEFFNPDGTSEKIGHRATSENKEHVTTSFNIDENGEWTKRRSYVWKLKD